MNIQILAADIVRRVQHSPDSAHNLSEVVANLICEEICELNNQAEGLKVLGACLARTDIGDPVISKDGKRFWIRAVRNGDHVSGESESLPEAIRLFAGKLFGK